MIRLLQQKKVTELDIRCDTLLNKFKCDAFEM